MTNSISINSSTPFLQGVPNSQVSTEWLRYLNSIVVFLQTGPTGVTTDDVTQLLQITNPRPLQGVIDQMSHRMKRMEQLIAAMRNERKQKANVADMRSMLTTHNTASGALEIDVHRDASRTEDAYPLWSGGYGGMQRAKITNTKYTFNPSTGLLKSTQVQAITGFACNGKTPQTAVTLGAASTDLPSVIALSNNIRTALINNGIGQ